MASSTGTVVRYTALFSGLVYGLLHQSTLQLQYDMDKEKHHTEQRQHLVTKAKEAYAAKQIADKAGASTLITDPTDPKFDLEKAIASWTSS